MTQKNETAPAATQQAAQKQDTGATIRPFQPAAAPGINGSGGISSDPFEDLSKSITEARNYARGFSDMLAGIQRKVVEAQKAVRQKDRDFRSTREILDKLKTAANF